MINNNKNLHAFVAIDGKGNIKPGMVQFRDVMPKDGRWLQIQGNYCCDVDNNAYVLVQNTTASANITSIKAGMFTWTGTLANGQSLIVPLFSSYDYPISITVDTPSGRTITTAVLQGTGTITTGGVITTATNVYTTSAFLNGQYSIILS